jgi:hypothetical protein
MKLRQCGIIKHAILDGALIWIVEEVDHGVGVDDGL